MGASGPRRDGPFAGRGPDGSGPSGQFRDRASGPGARPAKQEDTPLAGDETLGRLFADAPDGPTADHRQDDAPRRRTLGSSRTGEPEEHSPTGGGREPGGGGSVDKFGFYHAPEPGGAGESGSKTSPEGSPGTPAATGAETRRRPSKGTSMTVRQEESKRAGDVDRAGERAYWPTLMVTFLWYAVGFGAYLLWLLIAPVESSLCPSSGCSFWARFADSTGRSWAWVASALTSSLLLAVLLRLPKSGWRAGVAGSAAAVLGAGLVTVILRTAGWQY
ncbi:hypothetical protein [Salininema proteolyticum]|uniref:Uncharacterized protein n=1 Tax=Salininema proteolyticum TaxID=1607685 RepID=A0ABV8TXL3_9ACTN